MLEDDAFILTDGNYRQAAAVKSTLHKGQTLESVSRVRDLPFKNGSRPVSWRVMLSSWSFGTFHWTSKFKHFEYATESLSRFSSELLEEYVSKSLVLFLK